MHADDDNDDDDGGYVNDDDDGGGGDDDDDGDDDEGDDDDDDGDDDDWQSSSSLYFDCLSSAWDRNVTFDVSLWACLHVVRVEKNGPLMVELVIWKQWHKCSSTNQQMASQA